MILQTEHIIYIARKLHWTLKEIGSLKPEVAIETYNELVYQESLDKWELNYNLALIQAAIYNTIQRSRGARFFTVRDFYDVERPTKIKESKDRFEMLAKQADIILPKE